MSIFLDFEGARTPPLEKGERHHCGDCNVLRQLATGRSRPKAACQEMTITGPFLSAYGFDEPGKLDQSRLCRATSSGRVEADADFLSLSSSVVAAASRAR